jgi:glutamate/tyrosine decarboxylase-like PLP-dependent enzyme
MAHWLKLSKSQIQQRVFDALSENVNFYQAETLGVPASHLDRKVFYHDAEFLKDAPFLSTLINNPNHIGCHTLGHSENFFGGTQQIERELIEFCAVDMLQAEPNSCDGYVASGGTEANLQAIWIYRNFFKTEFDAQPHEISILCSTDAHYSMAKAANLLGIGIRYVEVDPETRAIIPSHLDETVVALKARGVKYCIAIANMMTTMFGSVDNPELYAAVLQAHNMPFKMHVDGAYGGFYFPFSNPNNTLNFSNPHINSVTLDAHKMVQAPYGTGIFLVRKNWMQFTNTAEASYVAGEDFTLVGSRSGANAIAVWMILSTYGPFGWREKVLVLEHRTDTFCKQIDQLGVRYFRAPHSNIVTMRASDVPEHIATQFGLVPDNHKGPSWYKVVVMDHVHSEDLHALAAALQAAQQ